MSAVAQLSTSRYGRIDNEFADRLEFLAAFSQGFAESFDLAATEAKALADIAAFLDGAAAFLFRLDPSDGGLRCVASIGPVSSTAGGVSAIAETSQVVSVGPRMLRLPDCVIRNCCCASDAAPTSPVRPETVSATVSAPTSP